MEIKKPAQTTEINFGKNNGQPQTIESCSAPTMKLATVLNDTSLNYSSNSTDQCDMNSLEILNKCHLDLFPKKKTICDDVNCMSIVDKLPILNGEYIQYIGPSGKQNEDILLISNFRLFLFMHSTNAFINLPFMLIDSSELKDDLYLSVNLKNTKTVRIVFNRNEKAYLWNQRINSLLSKPYKLEELFAFTFYSWYTNEEKREDETAASSLTAANAVMAIQRFKFSKNDQSNLVQKEFKRMNFDTKYWRMSNLNKNFEVCSSYPELVIVPSNINDEQLRKVANFRSSKRFPVIVWRSQVNGAVLARSSQPNVGLLAWRLNEDELLLKQIGESCHLAAQSTEPNAKQSVLQSTVENGADSQFLSEQILTDSTQNSSHLLVIVDARFHTVALANRVKGGGYEYSQYYKNCEIQFMNLENIHVIRNSFQALRVLCQTQTDNKSFLSQLESTKWLHHLSGILKAACIVTSTIDQQAKPVLIHCSDGWDRTPQILALAKLLLDPHYRTIRGFKTLIELDWLMYGHKFAQRNGHSAQNNDVNERSPVFLQWLDCVYQLTRQFPFAFEFNEIFLLKLCYHSYSCLFGTFLCNSAVERMNEHTDERTFSIWSYLNEQNKDIVNFLYDETFDEILYPMYELMHMQLWQKLFCSSDITFLSKVDSTHDLCTNIAVLNDNVDSVSMSNQPVQRELAEEEKELCQEANDSMSADLDLKSSSDIDLVNSNRINTLLKNAIDSNSMIVSTYMSSNANQPERKLSQKIRSFDDLNECFLNNASSHPQHQFNANKLTQQSQANTLKIRKNSSFSNENIANMVKDAALSANNSSLNSTSITQFGSVASGGERLKCSSESNLLLLDALRSSASPKSFTTNATNFSLLINKHKKELQEKSSSRFESKEEEETSNNLVEEMQNGSIKQINESSELQTTKLNGLTNGFKHEEEEVQDDHMKAEANENINNDQDVDEEDEQLLNTTADQQNQSDNQLIFDLSQMQVSTKTIVNESMCAKPKSHEDNLLNLNENAGKFSPSTSSLLLSSVANGHANTHNALRHVSTSTSDLSRHLGGSTQPSKNQRSNESFPDYYLTNYDINKNNFMAKLTSGILANLADLDMSLTAGEYLNNVTPALFNNEKQANTDAAKLNKASIKTIKDCLDVDGLTKLENLSCRKLIERAEYQNREIMMLREQVNKCKSILSRIASDPKWFAAHQHQYANEINTSDYQSKKTMNEESQSFGTDSICSSWDEVEENEYKLAPWVPDFYVTHCQGCNQKFSYRLRKHHCRNCGGLFCYKCSDQFCTLPNYNITALVRVCNACKLLINQNKQQTNGKMLNSNFQAIAKGTASSSSSASHGFSPLSLSSRCNQQFESNKLKKSTNGQSKSQKVSV